MQADLSPAIQSLIAADRSRRVKIVVLGDVMIDEYVDGEVERVSPEAPVPVIRTHGLPDAYPGGAANVAHQFRHWNVDVSLIGFADIPTSATLDREGLPIGGLVPAGKTPIKRRFCAGGQMVLRQDIERREYGLEGPSLEAARRRLLIRLHEAVQDGGADVAVFSDYDKGVFALQFIRDAMAFCKSHNIPVVVDHKRRPIQEWGGAFAIKMNEREFPCSALPENSIVTYGGHGYSLRTTGRGKIFGRVPIPHANAIGSGDCHVAHLALALAHGHGMEFAAEFAYQAGRAYVRGNRNRPNLPHEVLREVDAAAAKIIDATQLARALKARGVTHDGRTVFTNGVFDLLHPGHLHTLRWAAAQGNRLIVGLNSDESVRRLGKGDGRPFLPEGQRAAMLTALDCVDYVVMYDRASAGDVLEVLRPDKMVKGSDYNLDDVLHQDLVGETMIAPPSGFEWHSSDFLSAVAA